MPLRGAHPVQVGVGAVAVALVGLGHVVVDHDVDALDVDAAPHQVGGHQDALLALLELLVHLRHSALKRQQQLQCLR